MKYNEIIEYLKGECSNESFDLNPESNKIIESLSILISDAIKFEVLKSLKTY